MRFTLTDLLGLTLYAATILWTAAQVGYDNGLFWFVFAASTGVIAVYLTKALNDRWGAAAGIAVVAVFAVSSAIGILLLLLALGMAWLRQRNWIETSRRKTMALVLGCHALVFVAMAMAGRLQANRLAAWRVEFPVASLGERLRSVGPAELGEALPSLSNRAKNDLANWEQEVLHSSFRAGELRQLHNRNYERFVRAAGFGVGRMPPPQVQRPDEIPLQDFAFPLRSDPPENNDFRERASRSWKITGIRGDESSPPALHELARDDFFDPEGFGALIEPPDGYAGFVPHAAHGSPVDALADPQAWIVERLELVSLLRFAKPRVYVLDHLPRMDQLSSADAPTRPLDDFESTALAKLQAGEDVIIDSRGAATRMLGSLRAAKQCLDCHEVPRGQLLGAFSYDLRRGRGTQDTSTTNN